MTPLAQRFAELHERMLLLPNPWDIGSARLLESLGFDALATTSSGFAATLGRRDYGVSRDEALAHAAAVAAAVGVPVTADLENGFARDPEGVAETVRRAVDAGLAGCSIEDSTGDDGEPVLEAGLAAERVAAAVEAARGELVLTARAENLLHGRHDLDDTVARLQAYEAAGADVLYAPGLRERDDIRAVVEVVGRPLNVLALPGVPPVAELEALGVRRVSIGGAFAYAALGALVEAADELRDHGTYGFWQRAGTGARAVRRAFP
jgi:2-methylisocitrate lyase-like PEP mutase family enzyme